MSGLRRRWTSGPANLAQSVHAAETIGSGRAVVALHSDGSTSVADDGRGTETRVDDQGRTIKKPVMATKDVRFFDSREAVALPDGHPRRGMSVVAALSEWLLHTNRRRNGAWTQRYERGAPITDLTPIPDDGTTGTTVHFLPDAAFAADAPISVWELGQLAVALEPPLSVEINDERG